MAKSVYVDINESTREVAKLQTNIMIFCLGWIKQYKTPVPKIAIITTMEKSGSRDYETEHALNLLIRKSYIRRGQKTSNKTNYVLLRGL